jgi:hypothetical protein
MFFISAIRVLFYICLVWERTEMATQEEYESELRRLRDRYMELLASKETTPESIAERFSKKYEPLALRSVKEYPNSAILFSYLGFGYHFFYSDEDRRFELAEHYYSEAITLGNRYARTTCGGPGLAFLYWQYGKLDDARRICAQLDSGWFSSVAEWWWRDFVMLPMMFDDVMPSQDIPSTFNSFAWAPWEISQASPYQQFVLMLHGFNRMKDTWNSYDYDYKCVVLKNLMGTYAEHLDWSSRGYKGARPGFVTQQLKTLKKQIDELENMLELFDNLIKQNVMPLSRGIQQTLSKIKYQLTLFRSEYKFITERQEIKLLEILLATAQTHPQPEKFYLEDDFFRLEEIRTLFNFHPSLLEERRVLKVLQGLYDLEWADQDIDTTEDEFRLWMSYYIGEISRQIGDNAHAERYLERPSGYLKGEDGVIRSYGTVLTVNGKVSQAIKVFQKIDDPTKEDKRHLDMLISVSAGNTQILNQYFLVTPSEPSIGDVLKRINVQNMGLLETDFASQDAYASEVANRISEQIQLSVGSAGSKEEHKSLRAKCSAEFAPVWEYFPVKLQDSIITASKVYDFLHEAKDIDCVLGVLAFGTICEHAIKESFVRFLAEHLDAMNYGNPLVYDGGSLNRHNSWVNALDNAKSQILQELLRMAKQRNHPIAQFMEAKRIDRWAWSVKLYPLIDRIRLLRNRAAHVSDKTFTIVELNEVRSILWTQGLLYEVGEFVRLCTLDKR